MSLPNLLAAAGSRQQRYSAEKLLLPSPLQKFTSRRLEVLEGDIPAVLGEVASPAAQNLQPEDGEGRRSSALPGDQHVGKHQYCMPTGGHPVNKINKQLDTDSFW